MSTDLETRVRSALNARAGRITADRLRPAHPPTLDARPSRWPRWRPFVFGATAAMAVMGVVMLVLSVQAGDRAPQLPATVPTQAPAPEESAFTPGADPEFLDETPSSANSADGGLPGNGAAGDGPAGNEPTGDRPEAGRENRNGGESDSPGSSPFIETDPSGSG